MTVRQTRKEGGVVLLLILGFMAMFAVMVVTFIMMTTNMSESANSNVTSGQTSGSADSGAVPEVDARGALRTLMIGTNDHASPIGPFSIGENLYGEVSSANNDRFVFDFRGYDYLGNQALVTIDPSTAQLTFRLESSQAADNESLARSLVYETGSVLTFDQIIGSGYHSDFWNQHVNGTSALICDKSMEPVDGTDFYSVSYTLLPSSELKQFMAQFSAAELNSYNYPTLGLRINPPAFSGTGAGGFAEANLFDGEIGVDGTYTADDTFRLPFALWGNAAAPDKVVYNAAVVANTRILDARTFYKHLSDSAYVPLNPSGGDLYPKYDSVWDLGPGENVSGFFPAPIRMNPSYTAPDTKTPFLAHLGGAVDGVPSFHRPHLFLELNDVIASSGSDVNENVDWQSVLRKLTPRPLPLDHWNFSGSNPVMSLAALCGGNPAGLLNDNAGNRRSAAIAAIQTIAARLGADLSAIGPEGPWDVDNDGDGTKESVWIPSGLPIRSASDGTPYATFYSYLVLDMDGRVNVNTAGSWDQMPSLTESQVDRRPDDPDNPWLDYRNPFDYLADLGALLPSDAGDYPLSPWFDVTAPGGWLDDKGRNLVNREQDAAPQADDLNFPSPARRGEGFGPAEVNLLFALRRVFGAGDNAIAAAANILWNRSLASSEEAIESVAWSMLNNTAYWNTAGRKTLSQPGVYRYAQDPNNQEVSDRDRHQLLWSFTDPLYRGDLNENVNAKVTNFDFPWRGKTYISRYDRYARYYPTFDFSGSSLRVYDPLGNDFLTGAPRMSENPYLLVPYGASAEDSPYTVRALETLLRMKDYNAASGDTSLVDALTNYISDTSSAGYNGLRPFFRGDDPALNNARQTLTTLSSDIPLPAQIFPIGPGTCGDGDHGLYQLIRRCVIMEVYRKLVDPMENYDPSSAAGEALDAIRAIASADGPCSAAVQRMYGAEPSSEEQKDKVLRLSQSMQIAVIYDNLSSIDLASVEYDGNGHTLQQYLDNLLQANGGRGYYFSAINEITDDLYALLPEDIRAGRRLDLNALSREASWMGWKYDASNNHTLGLPDNEDEARKIHYHGLVERMKFARGLYVLLSALTWQERNASLVAQFFTGDEPSVRDRIDDSLMLGDYFDASLEECLAAAANLSYDSYREPPASGSSVSSETLDKMDHRRDLEQEFFANRLAQWCVNVVDFCDPDATMTPFFFDSTPMDGWWESIVCASGDIEESLIFNGVDNTCPDFYDALEQVFNDPDASVPSTTDPNVPESFFRRLLGEIDGVSLYENDTTYSQLIANWLEGIIDHEEHDFGFRRVWGMERPDLLLTETLNFHDLGIADTRSENVNTEGHGKNVTDQDPDPDFDQVRRPQGSTYLELYCAANPNIPQSPELYDFDDDLNLWKLDLSRMTPRVDGNNSPYQNLAFPVWRVAISASRDPHEKAGEVDQDSGEDHGRERKFRKKENSILERLKGNNASFFSFQPRQFNGRIVTESGSSVNYTDSTGGQVVDERWRKLDIPASNILGPAFVETVTEAGKDKTKLSEEVEIDRVVWMTRPLDSTERNWVSVRSYPDAPRLFWRVFEREYEVAANSDDLRAEQTRAYILPNRYFVIGPEDERSIGSYKRTETLGLGITPAPSISGYYGIPSPVRVILNDTHRSGGTVDSMTPILNPYNRVITRSDGTHEVEGSMRAATYFGLGSGVLSYKRGLNISEPLWTAQTDSSSEAEAAGLSYDPYRDPMYGSHKIPTQAVTFESKSVEATKEFVSGDSSTVVPDVPFDEPSEWIASGRRNANSSLTHTSPIAEDQIFGLGTVPGIRSAFLQRVADPNLPYHPLLNPYLTVDWNMMDLTVVNGEIAESLSTNTESSYRFCTPPSGVDISGFVDNNNKLKVGSNNSVFKDVTSMPYDEEPGTSNSMLFSSRQWGNTKQQGFFPQSLHNFQPNPWARAVNLTWVETDEKFGLQTAVGTSGGTDDPNEIVRVLNRSSHIFNDLSAASSLVLPFAPRHTLGWYNDRGGLTSKDNIPKQLTTSYNWYEGLETDWVSGLDTSSVSDWNRTFSPYIGAAGTNSGKVKRFEHLVWNDAPMTSPLELALVPASAPARFGTEFVRAKDDDDFKLSLLQTATTQGGRSLGSGTRAESLFGYNPTGSADTALVISPYLNFFSSVDESIVRDPDDIDTWLTLLGHSLNLAKIFEFVTLPSPVNGTREAVTQTDGTQFLEQYSQYTILGASSNNVTVGDRALSASTLREPGKINLNTIAEPAIGNVSPVWDALVGNNGRTISWNAFKTARTNEDTGQKVWFQSPLAASLSPAPLGGDPQSDDPDDPPVAAVPADGSLFGRKLIHGQSAALFDGDADSHGRGNLRASMADMLRLSGTTTNRSNVFAVWLTVGYFKVERVKPGVNMPAYDPDGNALELRNGAAVLSATGVSIFSDEYKYGPYYRAIYPDGYTYGEELGTGDSGDGLLGDGAQRSRAFYLIDRSVPFDFRRGRSLNWEKTILLEKKL